MTWDSTSYYWSIAIFPNILTQLIWNTALADLQHFYYDHHYGSTSDDEIVSDRGKVKCVIFKLPLPLVAGGFVGLLSIWFGLAQAAVTSPRQSHESHPVILGRAADRSWYTLQRRAGYPRLLRVMMLGEGINDDDIKGWPALCGALCPPHLRLQRHCSVEL